MKWNVKHLDVYRVGVTAASVFRIEVELQHRWDERGMLVFFSGIVQENGSVSISQKHKIISKLSDRGFEAQSVIAGLEEYILEHIGLSECCPNHI